MKFRSKLVGREAEQAQLRQALAKARQGQGALLLVGGEAGMGKTTLVDEVLRASDELYLHYACQELRTPAFAPITAILRGYLRRTSGDLSGAGSLTGYLNLLMPELGPAPADAGDHPTLLEAIRSALAELSAELPAALVIDDLQWADNATMDVILSLAQFLQNMSILMVGIYRSDEIPRGHPLRWLRNQLRRSRSARELILAPLDEAGTVALAEFVVGQPIAPSLASILHKRSDGVPLFVEHLIAALDSEGRLQMGEQGYQLADDDELPLPESIRDVVLLRLDSLTDAARQFAEVAAVVGESFDLPSIIELAGGDEGLDQLIEHRLIIEPGPGQAAFHHPLTREVIYREIIWTRRRALHRNLAEKLTAEGAAAELVASHWLAAQETDKAREALVSAAQHACHIHAYRDAAGFGNHALELWPDGHDEEARLAVLERLGNCAQLSGMLPEAVRAWREAAAGRRQLGQIAAHADTQRRLASVLELQGSWTQAMSARMTAAESFRKSDRQAEAAGEYLALARVLHIQAQFNQARQNAQEAMALAEKAARLDLLAHAKGLYGQLLGKLGRIDEGLENAREALTLALDEGYSDAAAANFQRLGSVLEQASDYSGSRAAYQEAVDYCSTQGEASMGEACRACLAAILWRLGDWNEALQILMDVAEAEATSELMQAAAKGLAGRMLALRGDVERARPLLQEALITARKFGTFITIFLNEWALAVIAALEKRPEAIMEHWRQAYQAWLGADDLHYGLEVFRWGVTHFAMNGHGEQVQQSTSALSQIVARTSNAEALSGLALGLGESLMLEGKASEAVAQFEQALALIEKLELPFERAQTLGRLGVALAGAGEPELAVERLRAAHQIFRELGALPFSHEVEQSLVELGEKPALPLGVRATARLKHAGLTRRQLEVLGKVAEGMTNREIADELVLSPRTVEMHVANVLNKLGCANRTEAVARAAELGLLQPGG